MAPGKSIMSKITSDAVLKSSAEIAFSETLCPTTKRPDFCEELEILADMLESLVGFPRVGEITHDPRLWARSLRAKASQLRTITRR